MKTKSAKRDVSYAERLAEDLRDPAEAARYLEAAMEDDDPAVFLVALREVATARGMGELARKAKVGRESLYKALSEDGNPEIRTLAKLLGAMGLRLSVQVS